MTNKTIRQNVLDVMVSSNIENLKKADLIEVIHKAAKEISSFAEMEKSYVHAEEMNKVHHKNEVVNLKNKLQQVKHIVHAVGSIKYPSANLEQTYYVTTGGLADITPDSEELIFLKYILKVIGE